MIWIGIHENEGPLSKMLGAFFSHVKSQEPSDNA